MSKELEIKNRILNYNNQIDICNDELISLRNQVKKLEELLLQISRMDNRFNECQANRISSTKKIRRLSINKRITESYCDGMNNLLSGNEFSRVANGLVSARRNVEDKICKLQQEIDRKQAQAYNLQNLIDCLYHELYSLPTE